LQDHLNTSWPATEPAIHLWQLGLDGRVKLGHDD
jgi:hypothetical protein